MSSVTRFLKQVNPAASLLSIGNLVSSSSTVVYEFVPSSGNVVGNYPPGYVITASAALQAVLATVAATPASQCVVRDMGKTILAPIGSLTGALGRFRQVQVLLPSTVSATQGFIGGIGGNTFGVLGAASHPDAYSNYMTLYIATPVAGVLGGPLSTAAVIGGTQM
jgi:hypothetical protein